MIGDFIPQDETKLSEGIRTAEMSFISRNMQIFFPPPFLLRLCFSVVFFLEGLALLLLIFCTTLRSSKWWRGVFRHIRGVREREREYEVSLGIQKIYKMYQRRRESMRSNNVSVAQ